MTSCRQLIVFESASYWQPELQRRFLGEPVEIGACRSIRDLEARTSHVAVDMVVLDLDADLTGSLRWLGRQDAFGAGFPVVAVAAAEHASLEWHVRELGATAFADPFIGGHRLAAVCRKILAQSR